MIQFKQTSEKTGIDEVVFNMHDDMTCDAVVEQFRLFLIACSYSPITVDEALNREDNNG